MKFDLMDTAVCIAFTIITVVVLGDWIPGMKNLAIAGFAGAIINEVIHAFRALLKTKYGAALDEDAQPPKPAQPSAAKPPESA